MINKYNNNNNKNITKSSLLQSKDKRFGPHTSPPATLISATCCHVTALLALEGDSWCLLPAR